MAEIPVIFFHGFYGYGKTTLIQETLFENGFAEDDDRISSLPVKTAMWSMTPKS